MAPSATLLQYGYLLGDTHVQPPAMTAPRPLVLAYGQWGNTTLAAPSDNKGNTWTRAHRASSSTSDGGWVQAELWVCSQRTSIIPANGDYIALTGLNDIDKPVYWAIWEVDGCDFGFTNLTGSTLAGFDLRIDTASSRHRGLQFALGLARPNPSDPTASESYGGSWDNGNTAGFYQSNIWDWRRGGMSGSVKAGDGTGDSWTWHQGGTYGPDGVGVEFRLLPWATEERQKPRAALAAVGRASGF